MTTKTDTLSCERWMNDMTTNERKEFEEWLRDYDPAASTTRADDGYIGVARHRVMHSTYASVQMLWDAWKARASRGAQQPAEGEEIMVSTPYDVFILQLHPSGLSSGPRFVVHVPGPEQRAAVVDEAAVWRVIAELRAYNPAADEHAGAHILKVWAKELAAAILADRTDRTPSPQGGTHPGYAGVTVWVGDMKCTMVVTETVLGASRCDVLLECFEKARHAIDTAMQRESGGGV